MTDTDTPPLYPGADPDAPTSKAWATAWSILQADHRLPLAGVAQAIQHAHPTLNPKTAFTVIHGAIKNGLIEREGTYKRGKNGYDTRMIRRHPATQETTTP